MDEIFFIEHYCLVDGKHIILKDYQKYFINWIKKLKQNGKRLEYTRERI